MRLLRDRWRRTAWARYFDGLDPIDRATFWIVAGLILVLAVVWPQLFSQGVLTTGELFDPPPPQIVHYATCGGRAC
jgi:hypothetical protein